MAQANVLAARINASSMAVDVWTTAMKIGGGTAYAKRINIERLLRDSLAAAVMAPSIVTIMKHKQFWWEIQILILNQYLLQKQKVV